MNVKFGMNVIKIVKIQLDRMLKIISMNKFCIYNLDMYVPVEQIILSKLAIDANISIVIPFFSFFKLIDY